MKVQQLTGAGIRKCNQDFICIGELKSGASFFLIADGMGGYDNGDEAARIVSENIFTFLNYADRIDKQHIQQAVQKANLAIKQFNIKNNIKSGATIGGVILEKKTYHIFWVGDVMVYQINKKNVMFQTKSHSLVNSLLQSNNITNVKSLDRYKHIVTRAIVGKPSESEIGFHSAALSKNDLFIICSDGVHDIISIEQIVKYADELGGLQYLETKYLNSVHDNYSIIVIDDLY